MSFSLPFSLCCSSSFSLYFSHSLFPFPCVALPLSLSTLWFPISLPPSLCCTPLLFLSLLSGSRSLFLFLCIALPSSSSLCTLILRRQRFHYLWQLGPA